MSPDVLPPNLKTDWQEYVTPALELDTMCWLVGLAAYSSPLGRIIVGQHSQE